MTNRAEVIRAEASGGELYAKLLEAKIQGRVQTSGGRRTKMLEGKARSERLGEGEQDPRGFRAIRGRGRVEASGQGHNELEEARERLW